MFLIHIHLLRIQIQAFEENADTEPDPAFKASADVD
jgi:hypothetical protein